MKSKKAVETSPLNVVVGSILVLAILGFGIYWVVKAGTLGGELGNLAPSSAVVCAQSLGVRTPDIDKDGLKDSCDNCVCEKGCQNPEYDFSDPLRPTVVDKRDDKDEDGVPDGCEDSKTLNNPEFEWSKDCKENMEKTKTGKGRCVLT